MHASALLLVIALFALATQASAVPITVVTNADGEVSNFFMGCCTVNDTGGNVTVAGGDGNGNYVVLEFDLGTIPEGSTIDTATLAMIKDGSMQGFEQVEIDLFGYAGDGAITTGDFDAAATKVGDFAEALGAADGTEFTWTLSVLGPIQTALDSVSNLLTLRIEPDGFTDLDLASLENATYDAAELRIEYTPIPEPQTLGLLALGLAGLALRRR